MAGCGSTTDKPEASGIATEAESTGSNYEIIRWQLISTAEWEEDERLNLWNGSLE